MTLGVRIDDEPYTVHVDRDGLHTEDGWPEGAATSISGTLLEVATFLSAGPTGSGATAEVSGDVQALSALRERLAQGGPGSAGSTSAEVV